MTKKQIAYFKIAKNISELSDFPRVKIGAVVVNKHKVISTGCNSKKRTNPLQAKYDKHRFAEASLGCLHAEIDALLPLINKVDLSNASIYIYRQLVNGNLGMCRPCKSCMALIKELGIKKIHYTTYDGVAEETLVN